MAIRDNALVHAVLIEDCADLVICFSLRQPKKNIRFAPREFPTRSLPQPLMKLYFVLKCICVGPFFDVSGGDVGVDAGVVDDDGLRDCEVEAAPVILKRQNKSVCLLHNSDYRTFPPIYPQTRAVR